MTRVLVTGGVRSGKSAHAESLVGACPGLVTYVAAGPAYDDADWAARIAKHRASRPADWTTLETGDVAGAIASATGPVIVDCLGTWLQGILDDAGLWDAAIEDAERVVGERTAALVDALAAAGESSDVVLVTNEVGLGVVPDHRSGRLFRDLLGTVNQRIGATCDRVHLVVAGRVLEI
ncbi:MAG TPA: bifunctional adenosylcobinamide kinase/adenosylcobinamide-phosphate guanylyltransferase [Nocardioides sp.]|nr:bifunctional adenosylcobinamide kinase/adenosylcobinamide-phosphate guanylyltransferase [Nocardioides sp.]